MSFASSTRAVRSVASASRTCKLFSRLSSTARRSEDYDVLIVGGGPVGLAFAGALGASSLVRRNLRVALVEASDLAKAHDWTMSPDKFSNRVSSLTNASQSFLSDIGAWDFVDTKRTCAIEQMQVWDGVSDARITFDAAGMSLPRAELGMARLTENLNLQRALLRYLKSNGTVELLDKTMVSSVVRDTEDQGGWPLVQLDNARILRARLLVGADGPNSPVRTSANISSYGWSYETQAIVATMFHHPRAAFQCSNTTAYQRFLPTGPIGFLPLSPNVSSLVWSTKPHIAKALLNSSPEILVSMINAAFRLPVISMQYLQDYIVEGFSSGKPLTHSELTQEITWREKSHGIDPYSAYASAVIKNPNTDVVPPLDSEAVPPLVTGIQPGTIASFPLRYSHTDSYLGEGSGARTVLVGDAAHTIHPLAGQGLNLGLADVECLAKCIDNALTLGSDIGSYTALLPYAQERYLHNHIMLSMVDKLHKVYSTNAEPVVWARTVGVEVLNELDSIKTVMMTTAGAQRQSTTVGSSPSIGWGAAVKGLETVFAASHLAKSMYDSMSDALNGGLKEFIQRVSMTDRKT